MAFQSYFDGGNQADSREYEILTLASLSGTAIQWGNFKVQWKKVLDEHNAPWLHTTDAVSMAGPFSKRNGWTEAKVEAFIGDCVAVIENCSATVSASKQVMHAALRPATVTVLLDDFNRALREIPDLGTPEQLCAVHSAQFILTYGFGVTGAHRYEFYFDRGESFYGHIRDRIDNRKSRREAPFWQHVVRTAEVDMHDAPALQAADVLAWGVNHKYQDKGIRFAWQERLLAVKRDREWFDYGKLKHPIREHVKAVRSFKLPRRRPVK